MKTKFLKAIFMVLVFIISKQNSFSIEKKNDKNQKDSSNKVENSLKSGMWGIQFAIGSNFTLYNFDGMTLSIKNQLSSHSSLRLGFNGSYSNTENDTNSSLYDENASFTVNLIYMYYLNPNEEFNIYGYIGGLYSYHFSSYQSDRSQNNSESWDIGPVLGIGTEYFVFKKLSLFAEYNYNFKFGKREYSYAAFFPPYEQIKDNSNRVSLESDYLKFGLSVYFSF